GEHVDRETGGRNELGFGSAPGPHEVDAGWVMTGGHERVGDCEPGKQVTGCTATGDQSEGFRAIIAHHATASKRRSTPWGSRSTGFSMRGWRAMLRRIPTAIRLMI